MDFQIIKSHGKPADIMITCEEKTSLHSTEVRDDIERAINLFKRINITAARLFGSAGSSRPMDSRSDLDFAVAGILPGEEHEFWAELDEALAGKVDHVRFEDATPLLQQKILKGILVYEN